ncbi:transferrin-binding protein-like solute binding protein [Salmonella enterica subsp. enterica]|nr:transferrin-binding protein-like solute binding protein [Salmonella enterica]ECN5336036.1 transferrin-binding protein-like solute binding protein [Salmonella enterica subsp. enterica serovar Give]EDT8776244.1 transferrin-binding protein-like solute binding protein [Salmonella enterica subsp. enterica serovar Panama]EKC4582600.1 transferrin-binding protein-like solute binding protein [Salmonella enterica subsp. enterica]EEA7833022.1 transferrin-binding protein-like solute binding protein [Sal
MKNTFNIASIILSCSLLTACGGGNSSKTHSVNTNETSRVESISTSGAPGASGNNSGEVTETVGSAENNSVSNTGTPVGDESMILSCGSACSSKEENSSKTSDTTPDEILQVESLTTSVSQGSSGNNSGELTEPVGSAGNNFADNADILAVNEATVQNKPVISTPTKEHHISVPEYNTGTLLTRKVGDIGSSMIDKSGVVDPVAFSVRIKDGEAIVDIKPVHTGDPADYRELVSKNLNILRDQSGEAVGFYGLVETYTVETERWGLYGKDRYGRQDYIVAMNGEEKKLPSVTADYIGKLYYDENQAPAKEADIRLRYEERQITGTIIDKDRPHFSLEIDTRKPHEVDEDGSFMAALVGMNDHTDQKMHGHLEGGFYGKNGEIVAGSVRSRDDHSWGGVFGGEKQL